MWVCGVLFGLAVAHSYGVGMGDTQLNIFSSANKLEWVFQNGASQISKSEIRERSYVLSLLVSPYLERVIAGYCLPGKPCITYLFIYLLESMSKGVGQKEKQTPH